MNYEFRIKTLEKEMAHLIAMKDLARERMDTTDNRLTSLESITRDNAAIVKSLAESVNLLVARIDQLTGRMDQLTGKMDGLIDAIVAQQRNGK